LFSFFFLFQLMNGYVSCQSGLVFWGPGGVKHSTRGANYTVTSVVFEPTESVIHG